MNIFFSSSWFAWSWISLFLQKGRVRLHEGSKTYHVQIIIFAFVKCTLLYNNLSSCIKEHSQETIINLYCKQVEPHGVIVMNGWFSRMYGGFVAFCLFFCFKMLLAPPTATNHRAFWHFGSAIVWISNPLCRCVGKYFESNTEVSFECMHSHTPWYIIRDNSFDFCVFEIPLTCRYKDMQNDGQVYTPHPILQISWQTAVGKRCE